MAGNYRVIGIVALFLAELAMLAGLYQFFAQIECHLTGAQATCDFLRSLVARALVVFAVGALLVRARPQVFGTFLTKAASHSTARMLGVHLSGVVLLLVPLAMAGGDDLGAIFGRALAPWVSGALAAMVGGLLWLAPWGAWRHLLAADFPALLPILLAAALLPDVAETALPLWDWQVLTSATFAAVALFLTLFATGVDGSAQDYIIGVDGFFVHIARQCSGVEGFALVTGFVALYAFVFRGEVRQIRFWLVVLPLGLVLSWLLNVVRIGTLVLIGARLSPEVAVNGFHSYAGWLFFTLLAFSLIWMVQKSGWLHHRQLAAAAHPPLHQDPVAAAILPFVAFMVTSTLLAAVLPSQGLGFPLITLVLGGFALWFLPVYRRAVTAPSGLALLAGVLVGAGWIITAPAPDLVLEMAVADMPIALFAAWAVLRVAGTVVLVPLVEEMFFRGYLLMRLDGPGVGRRVLAVLASSLAFGALHGRWVEAGLAGVVFALLCLRQGKVSEAIWAHVTANALVAAAALAQREWSLI